MCIINQINVNFKLLQAPESYKNVTDVVDTCKFLTFSTNVTFSERIFSPLGHAAGISQKCVKLRPIAVIKG